MGAEQAIRRRVRDPDKPRTPRQQARRDRILMETRRLIVAKGYEAVTMDDLAATSGVAKKTLYDIYGSKEALLAACVDQRVSEVFTRIEAALTGRGVERLLAILARTAEAVMQEPLLQRALEPVLLSHLSQFDVVRVFRELHKGCLLEIAAAEEWDPAVDVDFIARNLLVDHIALENWWAAGIIDGDELRAFSLLNACRILLPVTRGAARRTVEAHIAELQQDLKGWRWGLSADEPGAA
ncbi:MAG: TetR family transcriptional regulator [Alphaproteobacteria bacterium]|nr:TetR family transcriptional regulator [Alphaproteobacteria bacterium]